MESWTPFILLGLGLLALWLYMLSGSLSRRPARSGQRRPPPSRSGPARLTAGQWEGRVLNQMRGDRARFERTLAAKRVKHPRASREELLEIIYEEYVRDNR